MDNVVLADVFRAVGYERCGGDGWVGKEDGKGLELRLRLC